MLLKQMVFGQTILFQTDRHLMTYLHCLGQVFLPRLQPSPVDQLLSRRILEINKQISGLFKMN